MKKFKIILIALFVVNIAMAQQRFFTTNVNNIQNKAELTQNNKLIEMSGSISKHSEKSLLQIPDDINGRLYRLCKIWGYFKYFHQDKCTLKWDTLLNTTIKQVLLSTNNIDFNNILMVMFNKVGNNSYIANSGLLPDTNINFSNTWIADTVFSQTVRNFLDTFSVYIYPDISTCFLKYNDYTNTSYPYYIDSRKDTISMPINFINESDRLTTMFYYWNFINYFHPFKDIMDQSWDSTLYHFIPLIRQASTVNDFHKTFLKLITKINDSHGYTSSTVLTNTFWGGKYLPQIYFTRIDTNCVVTKLQNISGITPGDILISINGNGIHDIEDSLRNFIPASTPAALYRDIYCQMMFGSLNSSFNCTFLDSTNNQYNVTLTRTMYNNNWHNWTYDLGNTSSYFITTCGYGYVDMGMLQSSQVISMYNALRNTPAIIFDLRNYPNGTLWGLGPLFFSAPIVSAFYYEPALTKIFQYYMPGWYYISDDGSNLGNWSNDDPYSGKIYILVNQETQSQAEYTCQYLSFHPNSKVIGTQTAGADGSISAVTLPDGIRTFFTSQGWYYADGYQQQRNGVKIDSIVSPTIVGLRHGRDEILEAVFNCQYGINALNIVKNEVSVYPNPISNELNIEIKGDEHKLGFEILNSMGQIVFKGNMTEKIIVPTTKFAPGIYIVKLENDITFEIRKIVKE